MEATDYIHKYETTYPAVSGTKELIHYTEWLIKEIRQSQQLGKEGR